MRPFWLVLFFAVPFVAASQVRFVPDRIDIDVNGTPFTSFHFGTDAGKPFLWPLRTADGKVITRRFPVETNNSDSHDHPHHRGLWFSYDDVNGIKFWDNDATFTKQDYGHIFAHGVNWDQKAGTLETTLDWNDMSGNTLLQEHRIMTFRGGPDVRIIDFDITLTPTRKVTFGDTKEGAFAVRLADQLNEQHGGHMVSSAGGHGMKEIWGKQADWVDYSGKLGGETVGIAMFDTPGNTRPARWHARDYGLFAINQFGQKAFDPGQPESHLTFEAGQPAHFRYRVVIHQGSAYDPAKIAQLYKEWTAHP